MGVALAITHKIHSLFMGQGLWPERSFIHKKQRQYGGQTCFASGNLFIFFSPSKICPMFVSF